jgi:hypothetical protein
MNACRTFALACAAGAILNCGSPFFPESGEPAVGVSGRATPKATIEQLLSAYQNKSIDMYEDLFPADNSFRFYVAPGFFETTLGNVNVTPEVLDSQFAHVPAGTYHYWTYSDELAAHRGLFEAAQSISISLRPIFDADDFVAHLSEGGDTVGVEVLMVSGEILVSWQDGPTLYQEPIEIERQVFYLVRDQERMWVISKWFDFGQSG